MAILPDVKSRPARPRAADTIGTIRMIECRVCGASNRSSRASCFNCGTLLRAGGVEGREFVRVVFGDIAVSRWDELARGDAPETPAG